MDNVHIKHWHNGVLQDERSLHNVWTSYGRTYLSELVSVQAFDPTGDIPLRNDRIKYLGLGIGSITAQDYTLRETSFLTAYPPGYDPHSTGGRKYNHKAPLGPEITTLERPVRISGSAVPYGAAPSTDTWLMGGDSSVIVEFEDINSVTYMFTLDCTGGRIVSAAMPYMPISELGLFTSAADPHKAYNNAVAYANFSDVQVRAGSLVTISWTVRFAT